jgi:alkylated DNA repair dioxygenase AlkB
MFSSTKVKKGQNQMSLISGLSVIPNYIGLEQHDLLMSIIDGQIWQTDLPRRVQHYGWRYDYQARQIGTDNYLGTLPAWLDQIAQQMLNDGYFAAKSDQCIINDYEPGQGIGWHIDCQPCFEPIIATISLSSAVDFEMRLKDRHETIRLLPRTLLVMSGEARDHWAHGIAKRKSDKVDDVYVARGRRLSLTFRNVVLTLEGQI